MNIMEKIKTLFNKYYTYITYIFSAGFSFVLDLVLFSLILWFIDDIIISSYLARAISSFINYLVNKYKVFKYEKKTDKKDNTIFEYFGLVIINVTVSAVLVDAISAVLPIYATIIKGVIDVVIFVINFFIQKLFIFNKDNRNTSFLKYILPLVSFVSIFIKLSDTGISFDYEIISMIIVLPLLYYLYIKVFKSDNYKALNILSLVFTVLMILGASYDTNYTP